MSALMTMEELRVWTRDDTIEDDDPTALAILEAASLRVRTAAEHDDWTAATVPQRARLICILLAKRTWQFPDPIIQEGNIGPLGGDRVIEEYARTLVLLPEEITELQALRGDGSGSPAGGLWVLPTARISKLRTLYLFDTDSDWAFPYADNPPDGYIFPPEDL